MIAEGVLDQLVGLFQVASRPLLLRVIGPMTTLYVTLFIIDFSWDGVHWALTDSPQALGQALRKLVIFIIIYGLLLVSPLWLGEILSGFSDFGREMTGLEGLSPSTIFAHGLELTLDFYSTWDGFISSIVPTPANVLRHFTALAVFISFTLIAFQLTRVLIEIALALGGLAIFLSFFGHKLTYGIGEGYLRYLVKLGVRLFTVYLLVGVGANLGHLWNTMLDAQSSLFFPDPRPLLAIAAAALIWGGIVLILPGTVAHEIAGGFSMTAFNPMRRHAD